MFCFFNLMKPNLRKHHTEIQTIINTMNKTSKCKNIRFQKNNNVNNKEPQKNSIDILSLHVIIHC